MPFANRVRVVEVGPRDGLQNEPEVVPADVKIELVRRLNESGLSNIEVSSFVSPKWVPQMADSAEVMRRIERRPGVTYSALVPNMQGYAAARAVNVEEIAIFTAASETFTRKNVNCSIDQSLERFESILAAAKADGVRVRGYISCCFGCPFEGDIDPAVVVRVARRLYESGCYEVALGDTIGVATPRLARHIVEATADYVPLPHIAVHLHDTYGQALANLLAVLELGVTTVDASVAGLGGCPYAPGATGNVATEDVVYMLNQMGIETGVDLQKLAEAGHYICQILGRKPAGRVSNALLARRPTAAPVCV